MSGGLAPAVQMEGPALVVHEPGEVVVGALESGGGVADGGKGVGEQQVASRALGRSLAGYERGPARLTGRGWTPGAYPKAEADPECTQQP